MKNYVRSRPHRAAAARAGKNREKGKGHPVTSDHIDYSVDDLEFQDAIQDWQNRTGRKFPTWREVLSVLKSIGYAKTA